MAVDGLPREARVRAYSSALVMMTDQPAAERTRPSAGVVVPFFGDASSAERLASSLTGLAARPVDELILADNTPTGTFANLAPPGVQVVAATGERSSYHARNVGAVTASGEWIL